MRYEILLAPEAVVDLKGLRANERTLGTHLRNEPEKRSKSRSKRLKGLSQPQYRLPVGDVRVFYDVSERVVEVLAIVAKGDAEEWLQKAGEAS